MELRKHAYMRLEQRCRLKPQDIQDIVDKEQYCPIGLRGVHQHKLIYSIPDDDYFVLVHDTETDEILTILPTHYHNAWVIDDHAKLLAKKAILGEDYEEPSKLLPNLLPPDPKPFVVKASKKDLIVITITTFSITFRTMQHLNSHKLISSKRSKTQKIVELPYTDFFNLNFPQDTPLDKEHIIKEYDNNITFKLNFNTLIKKLAREQNINITNISSIVLHIYNINQSFTLIRTTPQSYWQKQENPNDYETLTLQYNDSIMIA